MASDFWASTHFRHWIFTKEQIANFRRETSERTRFPVEKELKILAHYVRFIQNLGRKTKVVKQVIVSCATVLFWRFYLKRSVTEFDPRLIAPTMFYLAVKVEEMGQLRPDSFFLNDNNSKPDGLKLRPADLFAAEMMTLDALKFDLLVFHPYYDLERYATDATQGLNQQLFAAAWGILNDSQRSQCCLVYPPNIIAFAALYLASIHVGIDLRNWFEEINLNLDIVRECALDIVESSKEDAERLSLNEGPLRELFDRWKSNRQSPVQISSS